MASLQGRHALVTGGGRGIGRAIAAALTQAGAAVTMPAAAKKRWQRWSRQGDAAGFVVADVTDAKAVDSGVQQAAAARGPVDLLIANAGTATAVPFAKATPEQFRDMFELHVLGMLHPVQAVLGGMIERGFGRIVAVASIVGLAGLAERLALHHGQARHGGIDALDRAGDGGLGRHRQRRVSRLRGHRADPRAAGPIGREGRDARTKRSPGLHPGFRSAGWCGPKRSPRRFCISARRPRPRPPAPLS